MTWDTHATLTHANVVPHKFPQNPGPHTMHVCPSRLHACTCVLHRVHIQIDSKPPDQDDYNIPIFTLLYKVIVSET